MEEFLKYRLFTFIFILAIFLTLESLLPLKRNMKRASAKFNLSLALINTLALKVCFPFSLIFLAHKRVGHSSLWGLNDLPASIDILLTIILFDFFIYWQHRLFHKIPFLWKFHAPHHSEKNLHSTTALRFHPIEIILSGVLKMILITLFMPSAFAYFIYEVLLSSMAIFTHSNLALPKRLEQRLRKIFVTPSMHTPHHSPHIELTNSNFGNFLSIWDYLFRTYRPEINSEFGLKNYPEDSFKNLIFHPFI